MFIAMRLEAIFWQNSTVYHYHAEIINHLQQQRKQRPKKLSGLLSLAAGSWMRVKGLSSYHFKGLSPSHIKGADEKWIRYWHPKCPSSIQCEVTCVHCSWTVWLLFSLTRYATRNTMLPKPVLFKFVCDMCIIWQMNSSLLVSQKHSTCSELWRSLSEGEGRCTLLGWGHVDTELPLSVPWIPGTKAEHTK